MPLLKTTAKSALALLLAALLPAAPGCAQSPAGPAPAAAAPAAPEFTVPLDSGLMAEPADREASGLAASRRDPTVLWTLSDSGNEPVLHAIDLAGNRRGRARLDGIPNLDWEELCAFALDGTAWLLVADLGDNRGQRTDCVLHFIAEPDPAELARDRELPLQPAFSLPFAYEDGPRDCEAVAVDPAGRAVYLVTKREVPVRLYRIELPAAPLGASRGRLAPATARFLIEVRHIKQPNEAQKAIRAPQFAYRASPTGLDFSPDGRLAALLTYGDVLLFPRAPGESWPDAFAREPVELRGHQLPQAEAICFARGGRSLFVCSEETMRWVRYDRK